VEVEGGDGLAIEVDGELPGDGAVSVGSLDEPYRNVPEKSYVIAAAAALVGARASRPSTAIEHAKCARMDVIALHASLGQSG
jgi:hypothetical protein